MKKIQTFLTPFLFLFILTLQAQTADDVLLNYFENTGGLEKWNALEGLKMSGVANTQGMEIPVDIIQLKDGSQAVIINFQGQTITQFAFDGEQMWSTNFMTMQPEKSDSEATANMKKAAKDFPSPFLNYKEKGYSVEFIGKETKEGTETFKLKLTQDPILVNGVEEPNVSFHYFDTENFALIVSETQIKEGPMQGQTMTSTMSGYQEVDGLFFPFDMSMSGQGISIKSIELNPKVEKTLFAFPGE
ncbi:MAG: outer membrane lipoprotein-sorting protein [Flavobacteriaceae bacterium CG2_30_34_30]|nr:MAG: outer membrane lipoprotein-sorting protein [Flavobacteriaceae bacterium CG2_30_34_30]PIQ17776.1 MAG: outer membrane lipoprotein-sorting protein [Flavobacteriaceae bacterium CG18_big_fil_WC_8_21_14_2_50_34_36]PIV50165.1 MAG: outer membrane lipoprotein-sorting protein [Flavobacteriaceae bacterium CG02_land_8_20_14_3_00_34_13]PIZ08843.1 MAG: outer membrane lipoprotein-sorting protein [Flavobacteriaceae bacterium CG_4_10_14_0_8_um_filter_34_31]PJC06431.1 MAG: outer membrane lipoprotein-sort